MAQSNRPTINGLTQEQTESFLAALMKKESSGVAQDNQFGYTGLFQFGAPALVETGLIDRNKYLAAQKQKGFNQKAFLNDPSNWKLEGGKQAFWNDNELQYRKAVELANKNLKVIGNKVKLDNPVAIAEAAAMAHNGGAGNAIKYLRDGVVFKDGNKVAITDYRDLARRALGAKASFNPGYPDNLQAKQSTPQPTTQPAPKPLIEQKSSEQVAQETPVVTKEDLWNINHLDPLAALKGSVGAKGPVTMETSAGTLQAETPEEKDLLLAVEDMPEIYKQAVKDNIAALTSSRLREPQNPRDIMPEAVYNFFDKQLKDNGVF